MKLPFMKTRNLNNDYGDEYSEEDYPAVQEKASEKRGSILSRIALYSGVFLVLLTAVGGFYYVDYTGRSLNKRISGNPSGLVNAINLGGEENVSISREEPFIEGSSKRTRQEPRTLPSNELTRQASLVGVSGGIQGTSEAPPLREASSSPRMVPEKTVRDGAASKPPDSPDQPETLLSNLALRDDNPFRDKFLKRFQESQVSKMSLKDRRRSAGSGQVSRPRGAVRSVSKLADGELAILPDIAGGGDSSGDLKVVGVIQTQETSLALTNKGELRVGSMVDGDVVMGITMNEVRLKSGRILKVTAQ